jgi:hypothetical protein
MNDVQGFKFLNVTPPAAIVDNGSFTTASIDTKGWDYCTILISLGASDIAMAALKLQESDVDSGYADVSGADFSVSPATLPSATDDNKIYAIFVDCRKRKRFLDLLATAGDGTAGTFLSAIAILSKGREWADTATERGLGQNLFV